MIAAFLVGGVAGWVAHSASAAAPRRFDILKAEALGAHRLYIAEVRHPIEVARPSDRIWCHGCRRRRHGFAAPDLETFSLKLLGGRLLPGPIGPAALFMYESPTGERYTFYCSQSNRRARPCAIMRPRA